jgi:hypothetical protein
MSSPFTPQPQASAQGPVDAPIKSRVAAAGAGATWWAEGWRMFRSHVGTWVGIVLVYFVVSLLLNAVPHIGAVAEWLLTPVFLGGIMLGCDALQRGQPLRLSHLFDGFKGPHFVSLLLVGVFNLALCLLAIVVGGAVLVAGIGMSGLLNFANLATDPWQMWRTLGFTYFSLIALAATAFAVIAMANWFAPALIVLRDAKPLAAMLASLRACMRNWLPFFVYGVLGIVITIAAMAVFAALAGVIGFEAILAIVDGSGGWGTFTLAAGILGAVCAVLIAVIAAVIFGSTYASYRDTLATDDSTQDNPA